MNHETCHELLCLRLYGELDRDEERTLDEHLSSCAECRAFGAELDGSLGTLARAAPRVYELPDGWHAQLVKRVQRTRSHRRLLPWATFAAGIAAGIALMLALWASNDHARPHLEGAGLAQLDGAPPFVLRADPPPPATGRGPLARLGDLRQR